MASWSPGAVGASQSLTQTGTDVRPDPKPRAREKATQRDWQAIHEHFRGQPLVGASGSYDPDSPSHCLHHIAFKKADSGDDLIENLCPLLVVDHIVFHDRAPGWGRVAAHIRAYVLLSRPSCVYVIGKIGWDRFNARYPLLSKPDAESGGAPAFASGSERNDLDELFEKPRKSPWDVDWLPDYREEDTPF